MNILSIIRFPFRIFHKLKSFGYHLYVKWYFDRKGVHYKDFSFNGKTFLHISPHAKVNIGSDFICNSGPKCCIDGGVYSKIEVSDHAGLNIGDHSGMSSTCLHVHESVTIGSHVDIGAGCMIFDTNFHSVNWVDRIDRKIGAERAVSKPVHIGDYVFIGTR